MTNKKFKKFDKHYNELVKKGTIKTMNDAYIYKLAIEKAIKVMRCSEQLKYKYPQAFEVFYKDYLSKPNQGLPDLYGNKITDKDYLFKRWNEDLNTLIV